MEMLPYLAQGSQNTAAVVPVKPASVVSHATILCTMIFPCFPAEG
jgi:hypothetical protein